jgi:hypothetical protein
MNSHQNTQVKNIQKVVICSHDRLNENDDTSNFTVELGQQVEDISEFKLVSAMVPLSSYTFNKDDDDKTFKISTVEGAIRLRNTSGTPYYFNTAYYKEPPFFGYGTINATEQIRVRLDGQFKQGLAGGQPESVALRIFNDVSEANGVSYLIVYGINSTVNYATIAQNLNTYCLSQTSIPGYKLDGLRFADNWQTPFTSNADAKNEFGAQTIFSHPDQDYDPGRDVIYFYNKNANQDFTISVGWFKFNSLNSKYDIPVQGASVFVNMNGISTKTSIGNYVYGIRPPGPNFSNYDAENIGFPTNVVMTNATLITWLNQQVSFNRFGINFSKVQTGDVVDLDRLVISSPNLNTGYRRIDPVNGDITIFKRLGFRYKSLSPKILFKDTDFIGPWENNQLLIQPLEPINIYYEIICNFSIQVLNNSNNLFSDLINQPSWTGNSPGEQDPGLQGFKINLDIVKDTNTPVVPDYYSIKMSSQDPLCKKLQLKITDKYIPFFTPSQGDYYYKVSGPVAPEPTQTSTVATGLIFQPYITSFSQDLAAKKVWWPNPLPSTTTISYRTDTMYTESQLLTDTQAITLLIPSLLFTIVEHKLKIQNTSETTPYLVSANERLGIPIDTIISPLSTYTAIELVDISSLNDVIYIALPDLYQDGKNSFNSFKSLTSDIKHQRPIHSSIVCSIWNNSDVQYGKYVSYNNQSDSYMRSTRKDLKTMRIMVLDSEYRIIDLNKKALHLELDFR